LLLKSTPECEEETFSNNVAFLHEKKNTEMKMLKRGAINFMQENKYKIPFIKKDVK